MLNTLLSRILSAPDSPTADLYFRNACADLLDGPIVQLAPTVFTSDTACLVMRHDMRAGRLPRRRRLIYLIDDDVGAGADDASLPFLYRQKLRIVEGPAGRRLSRFAGVAVVGSPVLARIFRPLMETHILRPYWSEKFAGVSHFDQLADHGGWVDMAYLGSTVHRADLRFVLPVIADLLDAYPKLRFHIPQRHRLPSEMEAHPRVIRIPGLGWTAYKREIARRRFHIALYPLLDTPFNRGRSPNKLIEHAVVGAAPVYSSNWREAARANAKGAARCLPNDAQAWRDGLSSLIDDVAEMRRIAVAAQALGRSLNSADRQRALWGDLFGVEETVFA